MRRDPQLEKPLGPNETLHTVRDHQLPRASLDLVEGSCNREPFSPFNVDCSFLGFFF